MAWTAPRTWVVGEILTAALLNTHLRDNLLYLKGDTAWIAPTLLNAWANYGAPHAFAGYRKIDDTVRLRGLVGAGAGTIFTLPVGYRPTADLVFVVDTNSGHGRCDITSNGNVTYVSGGTVYFSLSGISFVAT